MVSALRLHLAPMKCSRDHEEQSRPVELAQEEPWPAGVEAVFDGAVFLVEASQRRVAALPDRCGAGRVVGGSGVDVTRRLFPEGEAQGRWVSNICTIRGPASERRASPLCSTVR